MHWKLYCMASENKVMQKQVSDGHLISIWRVGMPSSFLNTTYSLVRLSTFWSPVMAGYWGIWCIERVSARMDWTHLFAPSFFAFYPCANGLRFCLSFAFPCLHIPNESEYIRLLSLFGSCYIMLMNNSSILITIYSFQHIHHTIFGRYICMYDRIVEYTYLSEFIYPASTLPKMLCF